MVGLAGVVVNDSILMVNAIKRRMDQAEGEGPGGRRKAMLEAVVERLRPVLVTSVTTMGGVLPLGYGLGGYDAMLSPMSLALGWGLAFTTVIVLVLIPKLLAIAGDPRFFGARLRRGRGGRQRLNGFGRAVDLDACACGPPQAPRPSRRHS
jgi:Cu/Ag efflux pump CusA